MSDYYDSPEYPKGSNDAPKCVDSTHVLKDNGVAGALPDTQEELDQAVKAKHYQNEKAMEGSLDTTFGVPGISGGDKITIKGVGSIFSGEWIVKCHTLKINTEGCNSSFELTRNAVGENGNYDNTRNSDFDGVAIAPDELPEDQYQKA